jgi:predicted translin family RNA/ssDNA-binding protein
MDTDVLKEQIEKVRKEITELQTKIDADISFFGELRVKYHSRESLQSNFLPRYDEMVYFERKLGLAQQRLASLLLELTTESIDQLDSSVKTLDSSVGNLSALTHRLVKSSKTLEYLTAVVILSAGATVSIDLLSVSAVYSFITGIATLVALIEIWRRARKELPRT